MNKYVEHAAALDCACSACEVVQDGEKGNCPYRFTGCKTYYNLFIMPSADVRPVVRCEECAFWDKVQDGKCGIFSVERTGIHTPPDGFCFAGIRRDEANKWTV